MPLTLTVVLRNCPECRYIGHSGSFTKGGAKPICDHPDASKCVKVHKNLRDDDANNLPDSKLNKQCWYWKNRVIPYRNKEGTMGPYREAKGTIPIWCPLRNGSTY